jgi:hypothetical protein
MKTHRENNTTVRSLLFLPYGGIILLPPRGEHLKGQKPPLLARQIQTLQTRKTSPPHWSFLAIMPYGYSN